LQLGCSHRHPDRKGNKLQPATPSSRTPSGACWHRRGCWARPPPPHCGTGASATAGRCCGRPARTASLPQTTHGSYGENASSWSRSTVRGAAAAAGLVVAQLWGACILPALLPGAQAAFGRVRAAFSARGAMKDTDRSERVIKRNKETPWNCAPANTTKARVRNRGGRMRQSAHFA
jgi:hypothetical protein